MKTTEKQSKLFQAYKVYKFEVEVKVGNDEGILEAIQKLHRGEWENND